MPKDNSERAEGLVERADQDCRLLDALDFQVGALARVTGKYAADYPEYVRILGIEKYRGALDITIGDLEDSSPTDGFSVSEITPLPYGRDLRAARINALEAENAKLREYAREVSKAFMSVSGGGSEMTTFICGDYYADPKACRERVQDKIAMLHRVIASRAALEPSHERENTDG